MDWLVHAASFVLHIDDHIKNLVENYGSWTYLIVFAIIFLETGFVVTPILPGDSLLFVLGALAGVGMLDVKLLLIGLAAAAIIGDSVNYWIGSLLAPKIFSGQKIRFLKQEYLDKTQQFYDKYGARTIILARFVPIVRTFAPFLAGVGSMKYPKFLLYNVVGGIVWVFLFVLCGYFLGNIPVVKENLSMGIPTFTEFTGDYLKFIQDNPFIHSTIDTLEENIISMTDNESLRNSVSEKGRRWAEKYHSFSAVNEMLMQYYETNKII
jgi:membrane-associated protein